MLLQKYIITEICYNKEICYYKSITNLCRYKYVEITMVLGLVTYVDLFYVVDKRWRHKIVAQSFLADAQQRLEWSPDGHDNDPRHSHVHGLLLNDAFNIKYVYYFKIWSKFSFNCTNNKQVFILFTILTSVYSDLVYVSIWRSFWYHTECFYLLKKGNEKNYP